MAAAAELLRRYGSCRCFHSRKLRRVSGGTCLAILRETIVMPRSTGFLWHIEQALRSISRPVCALQPTRWLSTVFSLRPSTAAVSLLLWPSAISLTTAVSRDVRMLGVATGFSEIGGHEYVRHRLGEERLVVLQCFHCLDEVLRRIGLQQISRTPASRILRSRASLSCWVNIRTSVLGLLSRICRAASTPLMKGKA